MRKRVRVPGSCLGFRKYESANMKTNQEVLSRSFPPDLVPRFCSYIVSEIILVHRFDRIDLARIFVYTYILHIYIIPKKNNKKLKKNLCFLLVIYVFCFLYVKK